jgi:hypothetical protein
MVTDGARNEPWLAVRHEGVSQVRSINAAGPRTTDHDPGLGKPAAVMGRWMAQLILN